MENVNKTKGDDSRAVSPESPLIRGRHKINRNLSPRSSECSRPTRRTPTPLRLNESGLKARLQSLRDYQAWESTKADRIDYKQIETGDKPAIVSTALSYGSRDGHNVVLQQFAHMKKPTIPQPSPSPFQLLMNSPHHRNSVSRSDPSFINYKTTENERNKIYQLIYDSPRKRNPSAPAPQPPLSCKTDKEKVNFLHRKKSEPFPKELTILKDKLQMLPVFGRSKTEGDQKNPQDSEPESTLVSGFQCKRELALNSKSNLVGRKTRKGRKQYLEDLTKILNKSLVAIENNPSEQQGSRVSEYSSIKSSPRVTNRKLLTHWPNYPEYSGVGEASEVRMKELLTQMRRLTEESQSYPEQMTYLVRRMRQEMGGQERAMNRQVAQCERRAFAERFKHKMSMQKANYKRNVKELLRCKKQYRLQKQREQIRANGIKRMKKMGEEERRKWSQKQESTQDLQDII